MEFYGLTNRRLSYDNAMKKDGVHIRLRLSTDQPISLTDFVGNFVGIGNQFEKFVAHEFPGLKADSEVFVKEVRAGSIEADLISWVGKGSAGLTVGYAFNTIDGMEKIKVVREFVGSFGERISKYFKPGGRDESSTKGDLADFHKAIAAIANDPNGSAQLEAATFENGERQVKACFKFKTSEAREAEIQINQHKIELEKVSNADHSRVLLRFVRPSIEPTKTHKRTGQRAVIDKIHSKPLSVVYASDLAQQRMDYEMREAESNIFRLLFDVDVNVEMNAGRPVAYRIMGIHNVIDALDDDD